MLKGHFPRNAGCMLFLGLQLLIQSTTSFATVIYQLREAGLRFSRPRFSLRMCSPNIYFFRASPV